MVKFFLKNTKGYVKTYFPPEKKKPSKTNCSQSLQKKVVIVLKKQLTHCIQKTIRQIHEEKQEQKNKAFVQQLNKYKSIKKHQIKMLSYYILLEEIKVDQHSFRSIFKLEPSEVISAIGDNIRSFYDVVKTKPTYLTEISSSQTIKNIVGEKKKIKKEKAKLRKKSKLQSGVKKSEKIEKEESIIDHEQNKSFSQQKHEKISIVRQKKPIKTIPLTPKQIKKQKTQFKKTGRNKFLQQKLNKKKRRVFEQKKTQEKPVEKSQNSNVREQTPHPSWYAKRQIKNQMFIQPFEGKKILLS